MVSSFNKTWLPSSDERKKRDAMSEDAENTDSKPENKKSEPAPAVQVQQKKEEQPSK